MKFKTTSLIEQKSLLAKLMAAENITVEHKKIPTAAFDVKNRVLYLPILKWKPGSEVYDLFCAHEVGHALWTPEDGWHSSVSKKGKGYKSFLNVVEDARIEKKIKRKFAGARKSMIEGYKSLMNEDFFGLRKMGVDPNDLGLIDRINLYTKAGTSYGIEFSDEEKVWVNRVERTESWEEVVKVCDELYDWCKENESETDNSYGEFGENDEWEEMDSEDSEESEGSDGSEMDEMMKDIFAGDSDNECEGEGASGSSDEGEDSEDSCEDGSGNKSKEGESSDKTDEEKSESGDSTEEKEKESSKKASSNGFEGGIGDAFGDREDMVAGPRSFTDEEFRKREEDLADMDEYTELPLYLTFPKINTNALVIDYKKVLEECNSYYATQDGANEYGIKLLKKFKSTNDKMVSYMVKEFEMKKAADIHRRAYNSKKGTLDMNKIHAYKYSENLFQQITNLPEGKNHGMVMFIDWSGSMHNYMKETIEQLINLTMFCSKVQIPFEVYAFSDHYRDWKDAENDYLRSQNQDRLYDQTAVGKKIANYKKNNIVVSNSFRLMNLFSSRMKNRELNNAYQNFLMVAEGFSDRYSHYYSSDYRYFGMPNNYSLGGTPLNDTIVVAKSVIEEFRMKSRAQIVNAVFLTDGQSNQCNEYLNSADEVERFNRNSVHIDDPVTRMRVFPEEVKRGQSSRVTSLLLLALKRSLGINLLGFFLTSGSGRRNASNLGYVMSRYPTEEDQALFRKEKFLIDSETVYDELYIINVKGLEIDEVDHMGSVEAGSTKAEIRKALKKNTKGKLQNRILLNAFIEKVA
jgi:hypothetical protein